MLNLHYILNSHLIFVCQEYTINCSWNNTQLPVKQHPSPASGLVDAVLFSADWEISCVEEMRQADTWAPVMTKVVLAKSWCGDLELLNLRSRILRGGSAFEGRFEGIYDCFFSSALVVRHQSITTIVLQAKLSSTTTRSCSKKQAQDGRRTCLSEDNQRIYCVLQCCFCDVFYVQLELFVMFIKSVVGYRQQMYSSPTDRVWKC